MVSRISERTGARIVICCLSVVGVFFSVNTSSIASSQEGEELQQQFLKEAPEQWKIFLAHSFQLRGHTRVTSTMDGKPRSHIETEIKDRPGARLAIIDEEYFKEHIQRRAVYVRNPNYIYSLSKRKAESSWALTQVNAWDLASKLPEDYAVWIGSGVQAALLDLEHQQLPDIVALPSFHVRRAAKVSRDGLELVQIEFENAAANPKDVLSIIQGGTLLLDPQRSWCLRGYEIQTKYSNAEGVARLETVELRDSSMLHFPLPVKLTYSGTGRATEPGFRGQTYVSKRVAEYDLDETNPPAEEEFRLSAFGLPEPYGMEPPRSRWYIWVAVAGFACLTAGFFIRRHYRQRA